MSSKSDTAGLDQQFKGEQREFLIKTPGYDLESKNRLEYCELDHLRATLYMHKKVQLCYQSSCTLGERRKAGPGMYLVCRDYV